MASRQFPLKIRYAFTSFIAYSYWLAAADFSGKVAKQSYSAACLRAESLRRAGFSFCGFFFAVLGRGGGFQGAQQPVCNGSNVVNRSLEGCFIGLGWLIETRDLSYKLE